MYFYANNPSTTWSGELCDTDPVYLADSVCQCQAVKDWYLSNYTDAGLPNYLGNPFNHYLRFSNVNGPAWHCELCPNSVKKLPSIPHILPTDCVCVAVRNWYSDLHPSTLDPVYYYETIGVSSEDAGEWDCGLCPPGATKIDDSICNCDTARSQYISLHPEAATYNNSFLHYWNNYLNTGFKWDCQPCLSYGTTGGSVTTGGSSTGGTPTPIPFVKDPRCVCLAARFDYYSRYPDVDIDNYDAVYHYTGFGSKTGRTWRCELCDDAPQQLNRSTCDCQAAKDRFTQDAPNIPQGTDPFDYWYATQQTTWHCELCTIPNVLEIDESCNCLAASTLYNITYPEIQTYPNFFDPFYHYKWFGYSEGKQWRCDLCTGTPESNTHYATEDVCDCPEAITKFRSDYPTLNSGYIDPSNTHSYWAQHHSYFGNVWSCLACSTAIEDPSKSKTCNCTAARADYLERYPGVQGDPWVNYTLSSKSAGLTWDCGICNDTCVGALPISSTRIAWAYTEQVFNNPVDLIIYSGCYLPAHGVLAIAPTTTFYVYGVFRCSNSASTAITINTRKVYIAGALECGIDEEHPFQGILTITLNGLRGSSETSVGGNKNIVVVGGKLSLHGSKVSTWTSLATTAYPGDQKITVLDPVDWEMYDRIVVATTSPPQTATDNNRTIQFNEEVMVASIDPNRTTIFLQSKLKYFHSGEEYDMGSGLTLQRRAEVGLISTRNIYIAGDANSPTTSYGAQVVVITGRAYISGVQITKAGQQSLPYRYPVQWCNTTSGTGQYFKSSTITNTYNRCLVLTGSNGVTIKDNFCYNFYGSGYVFETGSETGNILDGNLALFSIRPYVSARPEEVANSVTGYGPASFLITNPSNTLINNVAADSVATGFWFKVESTATLDNGINPQRAPYGLFQGNKAHSMVQGISYCSIATMRSFYSTPPSPSLISIYAVQQGIYSCSPPFVISNTIVAEAAQAMRFSGSQTISSSSLVNYLDIPIVASSSAIIMDVGDLTFYNSTFVNYDTYPNSSIFRPYHGTGYSLHSTLSNCTFRNSYSIFSDPEQAFTVSSYMGEWGTAYIDNDGSVTGTPDAALVPAFPFMFGPACDPAGNSYSCNYHYLSTRISFSTSNIPNTKIVRTFFNGVNTTTTPDPTGPSVTIFSLPTRTYVEFTTISSPTMVYQVILPISRIPLISVSIANNARKGDIVLLQVFNAASFLVSSPAVGSCVEVFNNTGGAPTYFYDKASAMGCLRLTAVNKTSSNWYGGTVQITGLAGSDTNYQPPEPYTNMPYSIPKDCQCVAAFVDYWTKYPEVRTADMDPAYHYLNYGGAIGNIWDCTLCLVQPNYINDSLCNCSEAATEYKTNHSISRLSDPFSHYLLYQMLVGYAYHCEYCIYPNPTPGGSSSAGTTTSLSGSGSNSGIGSTGNSGSSSSGGGGSSASGTSGGSSTSGTSGGSSSDEEVVGKHIRAFQPSLSIGLGVITGVGVVVAIVCAAFLGIYWDSFAKHGPFYCSLIIFGALLSYVAVLVLLPKPTNALCLAFPWFLGIAFSLVYGCLFIKTWALYQVWRNAKNFQRSSLTPSYIMKGILLYLAVEIVYLIIWFVIDPPKVGLEKMVDGSFQRVCKCKSIAFWLVFIAVKFVWLLFGAVLSFLTRNMLKEYNESKSIAYAIYNIVLLGTIGGPVVGYVQGTGVPGAVLVMEVLLIVLAFTFTLLALFGGIIYGIVMPHKDTLGMKLSTMAKSNPSQQKSHSSSGISGLSEGEHKTSSGERSGVSGKTPEVFLA